MASLGQKGGLCGHLMAAFDTLAYCARCRDKGKGTDPSIAKEDCQHSNVLTEDQKVCLATPPYQKKTEKCDQKAISKESGSTLVEPALVSVLGIVKDRQDLNSVEANSSPGAKAKKTKSSEESSSRNAKDKKTESTKDKGLNSQEACVTGYGCKTYYRQPLSMEPEVVGMF